jgi:phospholipid/cholesterol/gamma-HCH transport system ATP-binding protein
MRGPRPGGSEVEHAREAHHGVAPATSPEAPGKTMPGEVLLECRDLAIGYGGVPVLEHVDLEVRRGEIVALLGVSGSGKSTLLKTITGLLPPLAGQVLLFGEPFHQLDEERQSAIRRRTGLLFQQDALFGSLSLLDNLALPLRELTHLPEAVIVELARMKLSLVGLARLIDRRPSQMSGGQRRRAGLARASMLDPELVFCDEPSAGLDPVVAAEIDELLLQFRDVLGITLVVVTHHLESIRTITDRAVMVGRGRIIAEGTIDELDRSTEPDVHAFFHRIAGEAAGPRVADPIELLRHGGPS